MADFTGHPDDELLFDLADGALDEARAEQVRAHLHRCAACAAFVAAATVGAEATTLLVEPMPADAASALDVAMAAAWRERRDAIVAAEAEADAADALETVPVAPTSPAAQPSARPRRRARRFVPILAFAVLALLAGTSVYVGQHRTSGGDASTAADEDTTAMPAQDADTDTDTDTGAGAAAPEASVAPPAREAAEADDLTDVQKAAEDAASSGDYDDFISQERACIATRDQTRLYLPDGRVAQLILTGPLGIYVVCG
jgi:hypothetical protein